MGLAHLWPARIAAARGAIWVCVMAIYHLAMKPISRSSGRSAVAAAAYRSSQRLTNERDGQTHDFTARRGVEHTEIVLPEGVEAEWARDRSTLWNAAEFAEKRKDARVAREVEVALPHELTAEQRLELTREFAHGLADRYGVAADFAIHSPHGDRHSLPADVDSVERNGSSARRSKATTSSALPSLLKSEPHRAG